MIDTNIDIDYQQMSIENRKYYLIGLKNALTQILRDIDYEITLPFKSSDLEIFLYNILNNIKGNLKEIEIEIKELYK